MCASGNSFVTMCTKAPKKTLQSIPYHIMGDKDDAVAIAKHYGMMQIISVQSIYESNVVGFKKFKKYVAYLLLVNKFGIPEDAEWAREMVMSVNKSFSLHPRH